MRKCRARRRRDDDRQPHPVPGRAGRPEAVGDSAGFPSGRRPADVVDVSLRVAIGALCALTGNTDKLKVDCKPSDAPAGALPLTDGVHSRAADFKGVFPYLNAPLPGNN